MVGILRKIQAFFRSGVLKKGLQRISFRRIHSFVLIFNFFIAEIALFIKQICFKMMCPIFYCSIFSEMSFLVHRTPGETFASRFYRECFPYPHREDAKVSVPNRIFSEPTLSTAYSKTLFMLLAPPEVSV